MCGCQIKENACCLESIWLTIPEQPIHDVRTIVIACCETGSLPELSNLEELQPLSFLRTAGGLVYSRGDRGGLELLDSLLAIASGVEHIIVCLHTGCSFVRQEREAENRGGRRLRLIKTPNEHNSSNDTHSDGHTLRPYEQQLLRQIREIEAHLENEPTFKQNRPTLQGWLYEPELDWTSFYDFETGLLLPLSAHTELCKATAKR